MSWYTRLLTDTATHWAPSAAEDVYGQPTSWTRTLLKPGTTAGGVRWIEDRQRFIDRDGRDTVSSAIVFVSTDLHEGDYLYHGESTGADPTAVVGAYMIRKWERIESVTRRSTDVVTRRALL